MVPPVVAGTGIELLLVLVLVRVVPRRSMVVIAQGRIARR